MSDHDSLPTAQACRSDRIVDAARTLFSRYGYRRTSMDDIARESAVAKATVYAHFKGKEDVFRTVMARTRQTIDECCDAAVDMQAPFRDRLFAMFDGYYGTVITLMGNTEHWEELGATINTLDADNMRAFEHAYVTRLAGLLTSAEMAGEITLARTGMSTEALAATLGRAAYGCKAGTVPSLPEMQQRLGNIADLTAAAVAVQRP